MTPQRMNEHIGYIMLALVKMSLSSLSDDLPPELIARKRHLAVEVAEAEFRVVLENVARESRLETLREVQESAVSASELLEKTLAKTTR